jgi:uncharacterized protein YyaL (SSP411 family)
VQKSFLPNKVVLLRPHGPHGRKLASLAPFVSAMATLDNQPTVYVCEGYACKTPITDPAALRAALN